MVKQLMIRDTWFIFVVEKYMCVNCWTPLKTDIICYYKPCPCQLLSSYYKGFTYLVDNSLPQMISDYGIRASLTVGGLISWNIWNDKFMKYWKWWQCTNIFYHHLWRCVCVRSTDSTSPIFQVQLEDYRIVTLFVITSTLLYAILF